MKFLGLFSLLFLTFSAYATPKCYLLSAERVRDLRFCFETISRQSTQVTLQVDGSRCIPARFEVEKLPLVGPEYTNRFEVVEIIGGACGMGITPGTQFAVLNTKDAHGKKMKIVEIATATHTSRYEAKDL